MLFEVSGVELPFWLPVLIGFGLAAVFAAGGVSGAFILLPFQMSVLGFTSPAVTPTNHLYNVFAIPGAVYRYIKEGRLLWPLVWIVIAGTLPGVIVGSWIRVVYLPDPTSFKLYAGFVLLLIGGRLIWESLLRPVLHRLDLLQAKKLEKAPDITRVTEVRMSFHALFFTFGGKEYKVSSPLLFLLSAVVGVIGGAYGVGGGAIISPFLITFFALPVYTVAGAALMGTLATSLFAVILFTLLAPMLNVPNLTVSPDWALGGLFGLGGLAGGYVGARLQRFMPQRIIKTILALGVTSVAGRYIIGYFLG